MSLLLAAQTPRSLSLRQQRKLCLAGILAFVVVLAAHATVHTPSAQPTPSLVPVNWLVIALQRKVYLHFVCCQKLEALDEVGEWIGPIPDQSPVAGFPPPTSAHHQSCSRVSLGRSYF